MTKIIDGKAFAAEIRAEIAREVEKIKAAGEQIPGLAVIMVGDDPASAIYVKSKEKQAQEVGFLSTVIRLPAETSQAEVLDVIDKLNRNPDYHGILLQLPVPAHLDKDALIAAISPKKDVDGFHPENVGKLWYSDREHQTAIPCTPLGCSLILERYVGSDLNGKNAVMIGASNVVGKPMAALLLRMGATVSICHSTTLDVAEYARNADILIVATGNAHLVKASWVKEGAVVLDVGINRLADGSIVGDVDFEAVKDKTAAITPVPGGIGPMTIACLLKNTLTLRKTKALSSNTNTE
ncbi:MAG: bifunctional methylenetetrahydrofolate dehydrogenase/methenyltetrahydrofolate cyclohydrolase FolD [Cardiobacteriaceae bacterium]|nr:bifunctional methylenetetrahydrofolate dehydrogenase/methenyltetrahydrofolate cyclohydrolase FolD [Cardiobacteriaceae bacterium]